jgi:hypothetical protein
LSCGIILLVHGQAEVSAIRFSPESPPDLGKNPWESEALKFYFESLLTFKDNLIK